MASKPYAVPIVDSTKVFRDDIFNGKVLFCTGGGSGICRGMTEAVVRSPFSFAYVVVAAVQSDTELDAPRGKCHHRRTKVSFGLVARLCIPFLEMLRSHNSLERLTNTAKELSESTKRTCLAAQADVRRPKELQDAVKRTIERFGRIDFVICGEGGSGQLAQPLAYPRSSFKKIGAAGNFLAPISGLSENGFRTVIEIDAVRSSRVLAPVACLVSIHT